MIIHSAHQLLHSGYLARDGLRKIASRKFKAKGPMIDTAVYPAGLYRCSRNKSLQEGQEITFKIGS